MTAACEPHAYTLVTAACELHAYTLRTGKCKSKTNTRFKANWVLILLGASAPDQVILGLLNLRNLHQARWSEIDWGMEQGLTLSLGSRTSESQHRLYPAP